MKIKLKNNNNLGSGQGEFTIQDKTKVESLYITGCNNLDVWSIFDSIRNTSGNQLSGKPIRLGTIDRLNGTWGELEDILNTYKGFDVDGIVQNNPVLIGTWHLKGMHEDEYNIEGMEETFNNELHIVVDKDLITFSDNIVNSIVNSLYGFEYDTDGRKGVDYNTIALQSDIGQNFTGTEIETFNEFQYFTGIKTLSTNAFQNCVNLTNITLPPNITTIGNDSFNGCSELAHIDFPNKVGSIGSNITLGCNNLEYVRVTSNPTISSNSFPGVFKIYVGDGSSPYHDNLILNNLLNNITWQGYKDRLDTWYNKIYNDKIPHEYTKLEYIESDASNIINTGFDFNNNTRFIADISFVNISDEAIYGSKTSGLYWSSGNNNNNLIFTVLVSGDDIPVYLGSISETETLYDINIKDGTISKNNSSNPTYSNQTMTSKGGTITLFGDSNKQYRGRSWMTKIYNNNELIHDFVPVCRISDNAAGFYDCIGQEFYGFTTYSGYEFDTRLITETNNNRIITNSGDYIVVSDSNTNKIKTSLMDLGQTTTGYYTIVSNGENDKKYSLETLNNNITDLSNLCGLQEFDETTLYLPGDLVFYNGYCYEFKNNHSGEWKEYDVVKTSAFGKLENLIKSDDKATINIQLRTKDPIYLDYITSQGNEYVNTGLVINDNSEGYKIVAKFSYSDFVSNDYIFGDYKENSYTTGIQLGNSDDGSCICSIGGNVFNIPAGTLDKETIHEVTLNSNSVVIKSYSNDVETANNTFNTYTAPSNLVANTNSLGIFANFGNGTPEISQLGISLYYFNIYKNNELVYEYTPALKDGVVGLDINLPNICKNGSGNFLLPQNFSSPVSNKTVTLKYFDNSGEYISITDEIGRCVFNNFKRDIIYDIIPETSTGWCNTEIIRKNILGFEYNYIYFKKDEESCTIYINISLNNNNVVPSSFNNLRVLAITDASTHYYKNSKLTGNIGIINVTDNSATTSIKFPKNQQVILVFPEVSGYTKQSNIILTSNETGANIITKEAIYTVINE